MKENWWIFFLISNENNNAENSGKHGTYIGSTMYKRRTTEKDDILVIVHFMK